MTPASEAGRYEQFLEFAPDAIVGIGRDGRVVLANAQTEAVFGYTREELLGQPVELLIPASFHAAHPHHRDGYFGDPRTRRMGAGLELFGRRKDGSEFPVEISLSGVETGDGLLAAAAIRDISDRVNAAVGKQGQLNELRRLESVEQLAGGIAHDFNNVLGVILNYADFVAEELGEGSPILDDVAEIKRAAERAAALTRQLLILSRREGVPPELLPASSSPASPSPATAASAAGRPGRGETVLVVDDEESVRLVTERILIAAGYTVMAAATSGVALEAVGRDEQPIDLLLTDVVMPEMLGPQLVERAMRIRPALRVLYMSGYIHQAVTQLGIENPEALLFVEKPFTADQLLARVRQALDAEPEPTQDAGSSTSLH